MEEPQHLTKQERKNLRKQQKQEKRERTRDKQKTKRIVGIAVIFLVIGVGVFVGIRFASNQPHMPPVSQTSSDAADDEISTALRIGENGLFVADQKPGESIIVNLAFLQEDGFAVIREVNSNGDPGGIPGNSTLLPAGDASDILVELPRATNHGESFIAMLYKDNGDGEFNPNTDIPVRDGQGNVVQMNFQISNSAEDPEAVSL